MKSILRKTKSEAPAERQEKADKNMDKAFELPEDSASLRVFRRDDRGQLKILDVLPLNAVPSSDELINVLQDRWGGGRYYVLPTVNGKKASDGFALEFEAIPKQTKKQKNSDDKSGGVKIGRNKEFDEVKEQLRLLQEKDREDRLFERVKEEIRSAIPKSDGTRDALDSMLANFPQIITGVSSLMGSRESASDMLEKISSIWRNIETSMPKTPDPVEQAQKMAQLIFAVVNQARPPVVNTAGTAGSGFWPTLIDQIARKFAGWTPAQGVPTQPLAGPGAPGQLLGQGGGFSGLEQSGQQPQPQQPPAVNLETISRSMTLHNPINVIRDMIREREDVDRIAEVVIYLIDFFGNFAKPDAKWMPHIASFLANPEAGFGRAVSFIPELNQLQAQDNEYLRKLRSAVVKAARAYTSEVERQRQKAGQPASKPADQESPAQVDEQPEPHAVTADEDVREEEDKAC